MQHVREILRQKLALGRSHREVVRSLGISPSTVAWKKVGLNIDYHIAFEDHLYSAPHALRHEDIELWLRATAGAAEIFHGHERVAAHARSYVRGGFTTKTEHMPSSHRAHAEWTPSRILGVGRASGAKRARPLRDDLARAS